jgi:hypothetical protein
MLVAVPDVARGPQLNSDTAPSDDVIDSILDLVDTELQAEQVPNIALCTVIRGRQRQHSTI